MESAESKRQKPSMHSSRQMMPKPPSSSVSNNKRMVSTKGKPLSEYKNEEYQRSDRNKRPDDRKTRMSSGSSREPYKGQLEKTCMRKRDVDRRAKSSTPDGSEVVKVIAALEIKQLFEAFIRRILLRHFVHPDNVFYDC